MGRGASSAARRAPFGSRGSLRSGGGARASAVQESSWGPSNRARGWGEARLLLVLYVRSIDKSIIRLFDYRDITGLLMTCGQYIFWTVSIHFNPRDIFTGWSC